MIVGELNISSATVDEKDEELEKIRRLLKEKQEELSYTSNKFYFISLITTNHRTSLVVKVR